MINTDAYLDRLAEEYYGGDEAEYEIREDFLIESVLEEIFEATGDEEPDEKAVNEIVERIITNHDGETKRAFFEWQGEILEVALHLEVIEKEPYDDSDDYDIRNER